MYDMYNTALGSGTSSSRTNDRLNRLERHHPELAEQMHYWMNTEWMQNSLNGVSHRPHDLTGRLARQGPYGMVGAPPPHRGGRWNPLNWDNVHEDRNDNRRMELMDSLPVFDMLGADTLAQQNGYSPYSGHWHGPGGGAGRHIEGMFQQITGYDVNELMAQEDAYDNSHGEYGGRSRRHRRHRRRH